MTGLHTLTKHVLLTGAALSSLVSLSAAAQTVTTPQPVDQVAEPDTPATAEIIVTATKGSERSPSSPPKN